MPVTINGSDGITNASWTTGTRPSNPAAGQMGFNTETEVLEFYNASLDEWRPVTFSKLSATGGTVSDVTIQGIDYRIHEFTSTGTSTFEVVSGSGDVEYLIVGGGGAGGFHGGNSSSHAAGAGGAGGFVTSSTTVSPQSYSVTIGAGGVSRSSDLTAESGEDSSIFGIIALGGGGGARRSTFSSLEKAGDGGSGGGESDDGSGRFGGQGLQPLSVSGGLGNDGAAFMREFGAGRGGGGGGGAGEKAAESKPPNGGDGVESSFTGNIVVYAGGGGGGGTDNTSSGGPTPAGSGGSGGGGNGGEEGNPGSNGTPNTGGGGGGAGAFGGGSGGDGGSGIVLIRYRIG